MQNKFTTETAANIVFDEILETIPGGGTIAVSDLVQTSVDPGTPVGYASGTGLYHVIKTAKAYDNATNTDVTYKVEKGHNFKVGDILAAGVGKKGYAITVITTSNELYDSITIGTTLGVVIGTGDIFIEAKAVSNGTDSAFKYPVAGLLATGFNVVATGNHLDSIVVRGSVRKDNITTPIHADIEADLPLIRFVTY